MIFKLQRPMFSSDGSNDVLIYDQTRKIECTVPMIPGLARMFGDEFKIFVEGECVQVHESLSFTFKHTVPDPHW